MKYTLVNGHRLKALAIVTFTENGKKTFQQEHFMMSPFSQRRLETNAIVTVESVPRGVVTIHQDGEA